MAQRVEGLPNLSFFYFSGSLDPSPFSSSRRDISHSADISAEPGIKARHTKQSKINRNEMGLIYIPHPTFILSFHSIPLLVPNYPVSSSHISSCLTGSDRSLSWLVSGLALCCAEGWWGTQLMMSFLDTYLQHLIYHSADGLHMAGIFAPDVNNGCWRVIYCHRFLRISVTGWAGINEWPGIQLSYLFMRSCLVDAVFANPFEQCCEIA